MKKNIFSIILFILLSALVVFLIIHYTRNEPDYKDSVTFNDTVTEIDTYVKPTSETDIVYQVNRNIPIIIYSSIALVTFTAVIFIFLARKKEW